MIKLQQTQTHETFLQRCFDLAQLGAGGIRTNPMVGAILVHEGRIIGEGFHEQYGQAHAEVNAVKSVAATDRHLIAKSTLYVSLEPCCFFGKTPACTSLILEQKIPKVVISTLDNTAEVSGKGVQILEQAGVEVIVGVSAAKGKMVSQHRNTLVQQKRPYIILKYAVSSDGFLGQSDKQVWLSNSYSKRMVHKWRSEVDAILVGTNTAITDNPQLTNRHYFGGSSLRIVLDRTLRLPQTLFLLADNHDTLIVTEKTARTNTKTKTYLTLPFDDVLLPKLLHHLSSLKIGQLLVEGGGQLLQSLIQKGLWDEARVLKTKKIIGHGIPEPAILYDTFEQHSLADDELYVYRK